MSNWWPNVTTSPSQLMPTTALTAANNPHHHPTASNPMTTTTARPSTLLDQLLTGAAATATPSFLGNKLGDYWSTLNALPDGSLRVQVKLSPDEIANDEPTTGCGYCYGLMVELVTHRGHILAHEALWRIEEPEGLGQQWQAFEQELSSIAGALIAELNQPAVIRRLLSNEIEQLGLTLQALA